MHSIGIQSLFSYWFKKLRFFGLVVAVTTVYMLL